MEFEKLSVTRKALFWWFGRPGSPYVSYNGTVDFSAAREYLAAVNDGADDKIGVHHLVVASVARTIAAFPEANARIIGNRLQKLDHVGIGMPVNLVGKDGRGETGAAIVERAGQLSLREIAAVCRRRVNAERKGSNENRLLNVMNRLIDRAPYPVVAGGLNLLDRAARRRRVAELLYGQVPVSAVVSNVGSDVSNIEGALFRGGSMSMPTKLIHIATVWGIAPIQDEVVPIGGEPVVRPMLPIILLFDHRLFDGVAAGRILTCFVEILRHPEDHFGDDGSS